jgi:hypothetical protein
MGINNPWSLQFRLRDLQIFQAAKNHCRSEPARDDVGTVGVDID